MKCLSVLLVLIALASVAAADGEAKEPTPTGATGWSTSALAIAEQLAGKVRAAGLACTGYAPSPFGAFDADYQRRLPLAAAIASCTTEGEADLTFEVFADAQRARQFVDAKQQLLCKKMAEKQLFEFPGFPYVDGGAWIVEPDDKETADKLAPILGGTAQQHPCK